MGKKNKVSNFSKIQKQQQKRTKEQKKHDKMIEGNLEAAKEKWAKTIEEFKELGYNVKPDLRRAPFQGLWMPDIYLAPMTIEQWDRYKNPEKWEKIDAKRKEEQMKMREEQMQKMKEEQEKAKVKEEKKKESK